MWGRTRAAYAFWRVQYGKVWRGTAISSIAGPTFYLAAMGVGLGHLVDRRTAVDGVRYLQFVGPGLVAAGAMEMASFEATWPVLGSIKWHRTYQAMLASPLTVEDVLAGHLLWIATRVLTTAAASLSVVAAFGALVSYWSVLAVLSGALTGLAFATPIAAFAATVDNDSGFSVLYRFVVIPLFLFSGVFFPVSQLPGPLRPLAYLTPVWHGVDLTRSLTLGRLAPGPVAGHVAYLLVWVLVGVWAARRTFRRRLVV